MRVSNDKRLVCIQNTATNEKKRVPRNEVGSKYSLNTWVYISKSEFKKK